MSLEAFAKFANALFQLLSSLAICFALPKYLLTRNQRSGETLLSLESRFKELQSPWECLSREEPAVTRIIDPEANKYSTSELAKAITLVLQKESSKHSDLQNAWMSRLDELLRFLSLVAAMEVNRLLKRRALWDAYYYWFCAIWINQDIKDYVRIYSPVLFKFLSSNQREIERYWARIVMQSEGEQAQGV